jgi:hypothetical protein
LFFYKLHAQSNRRKIHPPSSRQNPCVLCDAIVEDDSQLELVSLVAIGCLAAVTFTLGAFSGVVGVFGCDDCVSRL